MGDWRRVHIVGTCAPADTARLRDYLDCDYSDDRWGCLHNGGICGLPNWAGERIDAIGNLGESGYTPEAVGNELAKIVATAAPSLAVKVHYSKEYESDECEATITLENGVASVGPPEVERLPDIPEAQMHANLRRQLLG